MADKNKFADFFDNIDLEMEDSSYDLGDDKYRLNEETGTFDEFLSESETSNDLKKDESKDAVAEDQESSGASDGEDSSLGIEDDDPVAKSPSFKKLESSFTTILDAVEKLTQHVTGKKSEQVEEPEEEFDFSDASSFKAGITKMIKQAVSEAIAPMQQTTREVQLRNELSELQSAHPNFNEYVPAIKSVLEINPNMGLKEAFNAARKIKGDIKPQATPSDSGAKQKQQEKKEPVKKPAAELVQKAANLETSSGVSSTAKEKKRASNFNDAIDTAFEQLGLK